ncbi:ninein [Pelodytes ibericus]
MEQDQYEARLKELFDSFDCTGTGSLGQEELTDLCLTLQLEDVASTLQQALLQDNPLGRVHFDQFKEGLIDVLSSRLSNKDSFQEEDRSPEAQPKYIKDGKRYGRRSMPEMQDSLEEFDEEAVIEEEDEETRSSQVSSRNCEELWKSEDREEYEAEGQLRFWNPDELSASQNVLSPAPDWVEEKLQLVCEDLGITRDGHLNRKKLISICEQYGFLNVDKEAFEDAFQNQDLEETVSCQDFIYEICKNTKPLTPSSSTPYRQLKRHLSMQTCDESGRRTITPSALTGSTAFRLFSKLDDGTGYGMVEDVVDLWQEEGVENSHAILKALDFTLDGKINLTELTMTLENELLMTKSEVYQVALASFRSEIRHLLEQADQAAREKEKLRSDLEKNERFKSLMASEVDDHHTTIERRNEYNLRKLDEECRERLSALRSELRKEREQILEQTSRQRLELEKELEKAKTEESNLRDRLTLSLKESSRLDNELLETTEKLIEYEGLASKLQRTLDNVLREKFGDLDPSCVEFLLQEEKLERMRMEFERQRRELQDRIDELQLELEDYRMQGVRGFRSSIKNSLSFEMDSKNLLECDQGIGSEDCPPLNMSIEAEMAIEQMKEQHQREVERFSTELESNTSHYEEQVKEIHCVYEREKEMLQQKFKKEAEEMEEQIHVLIMRQAELEADIVKLKDEQQVAVSEHKQEIHRIEEDFKQKKAQLMEQESALQLHLDETKKAFQKQREELVQKAGDMERALEIKLGDMVRSHEEEKRRLELSFKEQISRFMEEHEFEKEELKARLLENHQHELLEERKIMEMERNRRISQLEGQFAKELESARRINEESAAGLKEMLQNNLQELRDQHAEEMSKWHLEKEEVIQESERVQSWIQETLEKEKVKACTALAQEKDVLEKTYKERLNKLILEKEDLQKELEKLQVTSTKEKQALGAKISQLERDLEEELTEKDEQLCQTEKNVQLLRETIAKLELDHKAEKEDINSRLVKSETLYKEYCHLEKSKKQDMLAEITTLQSTISGLQNEITYLSKIQGEFKLLEKEYSHLKSVVSQMQDASVLLEEERVILRNLQNTHEQTVKENVRLGTEISRLQKKVGTLEKNICRASDVEGNLHVEELPCGEDSSRGHRDFVHEQHVDTLEDMNLRFHFKVKELEGTTKMLQELEKCYGDTKMENGHLRTQVLLLQEDLNHLSLEYDLVKETMNSEDFDIPEFEEAPITIPGLKMLLIIAKKENARLQEKLKVTNLKNKEAVENNRALSSEVSWLQNEIENMEEMAEASLKLENMYEDTKKENDGLKALVPKLQEKIHDLELKPVLEPLLADKEIQTIDFYADKAGIEHAKNVGNHCSRSSKPESVLHVDTFVPWTNVNEGENSCVLLSSKEEHELFKDNFPGSHHETLVEDSVLTGRSRELGPCCRSLRTGTEQNTVGSGPLNNHNETQKKVELLRCENKKLKGENAALKAEITTLEEECESHNQKITELQETCEEMWVNLETVQNEKGDVENLSGSLARQVSELKARNEQLESENGELYTKNAKNQTDVKDLNRRLMSFLKQRDNMDSAKGPEEWHKERGRHKEAIEGQRSKVSDSEKELYKVTNHTRVLEQENALLKQEIESKELSKCSETADLKKEISVLLNQNEKLTKEKETLNEELNGCVEKSAKVGCLESKIANLKQEKKSWDQQYQVLKSQLAASREKIQNLEENMHSVNIQMSRIKSDLRVAHQEKEALKQEVMSLHKQLQNANAKNHVLEMAVQSSGLENQHKKLYWDDLEQLMEQEQQLIRQENERLQREIQNTKTELVQSREKIRQLESAILSLKHQKQQSQSSIVKALEQEKSSLRRECDQLQKELEAANRKISKMSSLDMENEGHRTNSGKFDEHLLQALHSSSSATLNLPPPQQGSATAPTDQYQTERRTQHLQATGRSSETSSSQSDQEQLLRKMERRMIDVEQKLRIVKILLQEKVNQLKEQFTRNTKADAKIKDLYVENSQLLKALEMSEQRKQTVEKKNYLLEEKISGLTKIVKDLSPSPLAPEQSPQRRFF